MVNPIHRPQATTETHKNRDRPPATLAKSGGSASFSHWSRFLALMRWKTAILTPAKAISVILAIKKRFSRYLLAWEMNKRLPAATARPKAPTVNRQDRTHQTADGPIDGGEAEQPQIDHSDRSHDQTDRENVDGFDERE